MRRLALYFSVLFDVICLISFAYADSGTPPEIEWKIPLVSGYTYVHSVQQTTDGGYIVAGDKIGPGSWDIFLIKIDSSGGKVWNKTFGGSSYDVAYSVRQTADGGYIMTGVTGSFGAKAYDFFLIKTDSSGNETWDKPKTFGGSNYDTAYSVQQTADGGYIIAGYTSSSGAGGYDFWLVKTDSSGDETWNKTFGGSGSDAAYSVQQTADGGYIMAGYTDSFGAGNSDAWLIKTDSSGNETWNKTFGGSGSDTAYSVQQTTDGGYVMAATGSFGAGNSDAWLIKTDSSGNETWKEPKTFGGSNFDTAVSVQQTADGGYIMAGYTNSFGAGNNDAWLIKTDSSGNETWNKTFGGSDNDAAESVQQTADGGYIMAGYTGPVGTYPSECWLIKLKESGTPQPKEPAVEMLDGSEFSIGRAISSDPPKLVVGGTAMDGAVTDGYTRLLLRMEVNDFSLVTLSIQGESNDPQSDNGFLQSIDNQNNPQRNQSLIISPVAIGEKKYVFAIYRSPENFVRKGIDKNQDRIIDDTVTSERKITLKIKSDTDSFSEFTHEVKLVRPPLLLVHGLWSSPDMWYDFCIELVKKIPGPGLRIFFADYRSTNASYFFVNRDVIKEYIDKAKKDFRSRGIAIVQADILGHSMGGLLARIWAGKGDYVYKRDDNFWMGDINKLITLDSPHCGSFLADAAINCIRGPHSDITDFVITLMKIKGRSPTNGAVENLMTDSEAIKKMNDIKITVPVNSIVGNYTAVSLKGYTDYNDGTIKYYISGIPVFEYYGIHNMLIDEGYGDEIVDKVLAGSDLVVDITSQRGGLDTVRSDVLKHHHMAATTDDTAERAVELLNKDVDSEAFNLGFPPLPVK